MQLPLVPIVIIERVLEILIGVIAILNFRIRFFGNSGLSQKDLLKRIERQNREIERLRIEKRTLKTQYNYRLRHMHKPKQPLALS